VEKVSIKGKKIQWKKIVGRREILYNKIDKAEKKIQIAKKKKWKK